MIAFLYKYQICAFIENLYKKAIKWEWRIMHSIWKLHKHANKALFNTFKYHMYYFAYKSYITKFE